MRSDDKIKSEKINSINNGIELLKRKIKNISGTQEEINILTKHYQDEIYKLQNEELKIHREEKLQYMKKESSKTGQCCAVCKNSKVFNQSSNIICSRTNVSHSPFDCCRNFNI